MLANADLGEFEDYGGEEMDMSYQPGGVSENALDSSYMQMKSRGSTKSGVKGGTDNKYAPYGGISASKSAVSGNKK